MCITLDIGGEGRHARAWNLNPRRAKTLGPGRGAPIPRCIAGRAEAIPFADASIARIVMERAPLTRAALAEIGRVVSPGGLIVLRHARPPWADPHVLAEEMLSGLLPKRAMRKRSIRINGRPLQETVFRVARRAAVSELSTGD